jgi:hypothetical protein
MNYTYEIKNPITHGEETIIEFLNNKFNNCWYPSHLKNKKYFNLLPNPSPTLASLERTKNWVLQNHPELLL